MTATREQFRELARQIRATHAVNRELARCLPHDCPPASAGVLTLLRRHGEMRMSQLTELLCIDLSVTSRHVAHAVDRDWIERHPDPNDGRSRLLRLTESGRRQLDDLSERACTSLEDHLADWPESDIETLNTLLDRLRRSFATTPAATAPDTTASDTTTPDATAPDATTPISFPATAPAPVPQ